MAFAPIYVLILATLADPIALRPGEAPGDSTRVVVELKASGLFKPSSDPKITDDSKPLALKVETRLEFVEKVLAVGPDKAAVKAVRRVEKGGTAINGEVRPSSATIRPETTLLLAELRAGQVVVVSPGGPLLRSELELVQGPGDSLALAGMLPVASVVKGDSWTVGSDAARSLSGYDTLDDNVLKATLDSVDDLRAVVKLAGTVRGSALGGAGTVTINGSFTFDRKAGRVDSLNVERAEVRGAGPVEAGLDVKSTLTVDRKAIETPSDLSDASLAAVPTDIKPERELLLYRSPDGKYSFIHDRNWHVFWDSNRQTILKRLKGGQVVAHCAFSAGPSAGKGRHQDPGQLREDIKKSAGSRFVKLIGEGVVDGAPEGNYRYKVAVQGKDGDADVLWYYYLMAAPSGDQVLAVFTLAVSSQEAFGDEDLRLIGTFEWISPKPSP